MSNITLYSLSDYNAGELIPHTFELDSMSSHEEYLAAIAQWLESVDAEKGTDIYTPKREEWIVCDYEDIPSQYVGEYDLDSEYWDYKAAVDNSYLDEEIFQAAAELDIPADEVEERYRGEYQSWEDMAVELLDETGELEAIPENLRYYFDYDAYARDIRLNGEMAEENNHFFWML